jgi:hypothetical protein
MIHQTERHQGYTNGYTPLQGHLVGCTSLAVHTMPVNPGLRIQLQYIEIWVIPSLWHCICSTYLRAECTSPSNNIHAVTTDYGLRACDHPCHICTLAHYVIPWCDSIASCVLRSPTSQLVRVFLRTRTMNFFRVLFTATLSPRCRYHLHVWFNRTICGT